MSRLLRLAESSTSRIARREISNDTAELLYRHQGAKIEVQWPSPRTEGQWELTARSWVGHIPVDDELTISIEPKVPLRNLFGMLEYAHKLKSFELLEGANSAPNRSPIPGETDR